MVNQKSQKRMLDYIVNKLEGSYNTVEPRTAIKVADINSNYIKLDDNKMVILVDQPYPREKITTGYSNKKLSAPLLKKLYDQAVSWYQSKGIRPDIGFVFFMDQDHFFRTENKKRDFYDAEHIQSLESLNKDASQNIVLFSPEELFIFNNRSYGYKSVPIQAVSGVPQNTLQFDYKTGSNRLQYFQESAEGSDAIVTVLFHNLLANYHKKLAGKDKVILNTHVYTRDHAWTSKTSEDSDLVLSNGLLLPKSYSKEV